MTRFLIAALSIIAIFATTSSGQPRDPRISDIIATMDDLYRSSSSHATIEMQIVTRHWERTLKMEAWTEGLDKTFIRVHSPRKEAGMGTLRIDTEMWNYLPKVNKVIKVPPSMMSSSWMGSDFTNDDLVSEVTLADDYTVEFAPVSSPQPGTLYLKATPHEGVPVVWGYYIMAVADSSYLPLWEEYYDEKGQVMRRSEFSDVRTVGSRTLPMTMTMTPQSGERKGNSTVIRYTDIEFDVPVGDDIFSLRNLRTSR